ncbi:hypothetical protein [Streptomyces californicus]
MNDTHAMASQLESFALEFEQMREQLCSIPAHQAGPAEGPT